MIGIDIEEAAPTAQPARVFPYVMLTVFGAALLWLCYNYMFLPWATSDSMPSIVEHPFSLHERLDRARRG